MENDILLLGLTPGLAKALREAGLGTVEALAQATPERLDAVPGLGEARREQIRSALAAYESSERERRRRGFVADRAGQAARIAHALDHVRAARRGDPGADLAKAVTDLEAALRYAEAMRDVRTLDDLFLWLRDGVRSIG